MYLSIGGNKGNALGVVLFCYGIMLVSKLRTSTKELYCIGKAFLFEYSHHRASKKNLEKPIFQILLTFANVGTYIGLLENVDMEYWKIVEFLHKKPCIEF